MSSEYDISYRKVVKSDYNYLLDLYESSRIDIKLHGSHLSREQQQSLIKSQFELQDTHYKKYNPKAKFQIVLNSGFRIGRLYTEELEKSVSIIEFTLQTSERSNGVGTYILNKIIKSARSKNKEIFICAAKESRESKLYQKLGFEICEDLGPYNKMIVRKKTKSLTI